MIGTRQETPTTHVMHDASLERNAVTTRTTERDAGKRYRFKRPKLTLVLKDISFTAHDPAPGDPAPAFVLLLVGGGWFRSSDLADRGPALLVFGSITCPVTDNAAPGLNELFTRVGDRIRFVMVNVREAHPGNAFSQPQMHEAKLAHAERLRDLHGFAFDVAVDELDGTLHRTLSPKPNSAYLVAADGTIRFRAQWANDTKALATALEAVAVNETPRPSVSGGVVRPTLRMLGNIAPVLDHAGGGAWADM